MAKCTYEFEGSALEDWLKEYFEQNGCIEADSGNLASFPG